MPGPWGLFSEVLKTSFLVFSDIEVARSQQPKDILQLADEIGLLRNEVEPYGDKKAKVNISVIKRLAHLPNGHYVVVAG